MPSSSVAQIQLSTDAALRLVCLPFAGGGTAAYYRWRSELPAGINLVPLTLAGHDGRLNEAPRTDLRALVEELADDLEPVCDRPYTLLGHSLGAWLAFELARVLRRRGDRLPELLVVASSPGPHLARTESLLHPLPDDELVDAVERRYGGIPPAVRSSPELLRLLLPALRADLQMVETYRYADEPPLDLEILALGGTEDPTVSPAQLEGWRRHSTIACSVRMMPGGHFFLFDGGGLSRSDKPAQSRETSPAVRMIVTRFQQRPSAQRPDLTSPIG